MRFRKLRIAWSVASGIMCLLLMALWVRSYWRFDSLAYRPYQDVMFRLLSDDGVIRFYNGSNPHSTNYVPIMGDPPAIGWTFDSRPNDLRSIRDATLLKKIFRGFWRPNEADWHIPYWCCVILVAPAVAIPWLRFSLRTLLIAVTLVAVVLGLAVYAA